MRVNISKNEGFIINKSLVQINLNWRLRKFLICIFEQTLFFSYLNCAILGCLQIIKFFLEL